MMAPFDQQRITDSLAAAAIDPSRWTEALETAATCTRSRGALLFPIAGNLPTVSASASMERAFDLYTSEGWIDRDERNLGIPTFLRIGVSTDDDIMSVEARKRSPYYQEFLASCNLRDYAAVRMGRGELVWGLSIQRTPAQGAFSRAELQCLAEANTLDPVVQTSAALGMAKGEAALDAFDFSGRAAILLDRRGRVMRANVAAERLLGEDLQISSGRVVSRDPRSNEQLTSAIKAMLWSRRASTTRPVVAPKASGGRLVIYPMRLPGLTTSPLSAFHAILVISDTDAANSAAAETFRNAFDLTAAESRIAAALATGKDLDSFAAERQLSKQTVRNQLKSVFLKTGTNRQAQLAVMLSSCPLRNQFKG